MHGDDLVIDLTLVPHLHQPYRLRRQDRQRYDGLLTKHQHIERVVIFRVGLRDETIVRRIMYRAEEHTIDTNKPGSLIELILIFRAHWHFDNGWENFRNAVPQIYVMPRMHTYSL